MEFIKDDIHYGVLSKSTATLINGKNYSGDLVIPETVTAGNTFTVTNIENNAFSGCNGITSITIETDADVRNAGLEFIKDDALYSVLSKNTAKLINGKNYSGDLVIPETVTAGNTFAIMGIGVSAFADNNGLTSVTIPNSVTNIDDFAFADCINLTSITIPESVTSIGNGVLYGCNSVKTLTYNTDAINGASNIINYYYYNYINDNMEYIWADVGFCYGMPSLETINIGNSVTIIGNKTFQNCSGLTSINIPESVTGIGEYAFGGCDNLASIFIETDADVSNAGLAFTKDDIQYSVMSKNSAKLVNGANYSGDLVIPETVTAGNTFTIMGIGERAFADNNNLTSVTLPEWVTNISYGAFSGCNNIETLTYNTDAVGTMFSGIQSLKTINIGDAVTRLEDGAFAGCTNLDNVSVGNGIENVGNNVFSDCNFLDYNIYGNGYYIGNNQNPYMILMSARTKSITSCTVSADCRFICDGAFTDCKKLAEVVLPESLTYVNNGLFAGCSSLKQVTIPESVTAIGDEAFKGCGSLSAIEIPESVTTIGSGAFAGCSGLTELTIPNAVTSVSNNAFDGCTGLESVVIGKSVAEFSRGIFANCINLNSVICYAETPIRLADDPFIFNDTIYVPATSVDAYKSALIWKRKDIMPFYQVKVLSANQLMGTAEGDSLQLGDHAVTLTATAANGYHFVRWSDGNTENPRRLVTTKDATLTATFGVHTPVADLAVAPTCETFGLTAGSHCDACGYIFEEQNTLPALGHTEVVDAAVPVTCTTAGKTEGKHCSVCNAILVAQEEIAALGHKVEVDLALPATCAKAGKTDGTHCSVCNTVLVAQKEVPALGHVFMYYIYNDDATTTDDGTKTAKCERGCGATDTKLAEGTKLTEEKENGQEPTTPENGTAVEESAANAVSIHAHHNIIVVENATEDIFVYNAMGKLVCRDAVHCIRMEITVTDTGIYIVKTGSIVKRVMVN